MGSYLDPAGNYYEGDRVGADVEVPQRPNSKHVWDGSAWAMSDAERRAEHNGPLLEQIAALEVQQARPLRELALGIDGARERLQDLDNQIATLRGRLDL